MDSPSKGPAIDGKTSAKRMADGAKTPSRGFSLIELMVVLVIIGLIVTLVAPNLLTSLERGQVSTAETQVKLLRGALLTYKLDVGRFPSTDEGLRALVRPPSDGATLWNGPYLNEMEVPLDPWNTPYRYEFPANTLPGFALYSLGADSSVGGEGNDAEIGILPEQRAG